MAQECSEAAGSAKKLLAQEIEAAGTEEIRRAFSKQKKLFLKQLQSLKKIPLQGPKPLFWTNFMSCLKPILDTQDSFKQAIFPGNWKWILFL